MTILKNSYIRLTEKYHCLSPIKKALITVLPILYIITFLSLYFTVGRELSDMLTDKEKFRLWINSFGAYDEIVFVAIRAVQTVIKIIPAEPLEIAAGYIWGTYKGLCLCMAGTEIGSFIILLLTSLFGKKLISFMFDVNEINKWSILDNTKKKYSLLTIIYLIPGTPKDFITYLVGITDTKILPFLIVTGIARIPSIITSTWCGELLDTGSVKTFVLAFLGITVLSAILGYIAKNKINKEKTYS